MAAFNCRTCGKKAYVKPSHRKNGFGKYCSNMCSAEAQKNGRLFPCETCGKQIYRSLKFQARSKSGKFFCSKSCQTMWRNTTYSGEQHANWKGGTSSYRQRLSRAGIEVICKKCGNTDKRILAVHHKDRDRQNNSISNLNWLCHNCHYLVHHYKTETKNFINSKV